MVILYAPGTFEPRQVPDMEVKRFLQRGYRRQHPHAAAIAAAAAPLGASQTSDDSKLINVNTASLKDLGNLPGVSMMIANIIKSKRPFKTVEDLIEATTDVDWVAIEHKITF